MTADVIQLRPREFYAVVPGCGEGKPEPVFYARTLNGTESALTHAALLSAGGGLQYITLTEGRRTWIWRTFQNGQVVPSPIAPPPFETVLRPTAGDVREGAPHGHIPEICTHKKHLASGRPPRRNRNMPRPQWPGII